MHPTVVLWKVKPRSTAMIVLLRLHWDPWTRALLVLVATKSYSVMVVVKKLMNIKTVVSVSLSMKRPSLVHATAVI